MLAVFLLFESVKVVLAQDDNSQIASLYQLQAAYHRAASVHDPINGDSPVAITQRIRDMLSLWSEGAVLHLSVGSSAIDGFYLGTGDPEDLSTCPSPSDDPNNRGTLCTFFKYRSGAFQPANKLVSLTPSYKTSFYLHGKTATIYFECHYFNVAADAVTGRPLWTSVSHARFNGLVRNVNGRWHFWYMEATVPPLPKP
jgi:hypothetical protein